MEYKNYYDILGVSRNADTKEIKKAFRKLAQQYHPDRNPNDAEAERKFKEVNEAYTVLGDEEKRQQYDRFGAQWEQYARAGAAGPGGMGGGYTSVSPEDIEEILRRMGMGGAAGRTRANGQRGSGFSSFFESLFGGAPGGQSYGGQSYGGQSYGGGSPFVETYGAPGGGYSGGFGGFDPRTRTETPQRTEVPVSVSLEEAFHGTKRTLESADGRRVEVDIPRGAKTGSKIRVPSPSGQGDLLLKVTVQPHEQFTRDDDNLRVRVPVDLYTAVLGGEAQVPTLERPVVLSIPAGSQNRKTFRLRGLGMPQLRNPEQRGDLLAELDVQIPTDLSDEERSHFEALRALA